MAIVMVVLGLLLVAFVGAYNLYVKNKVEEETVARVNLVVNALAHHLIQHGRYPCPAPLDKGRDDPQYGMETDCADTGVAAIGQCANGVCVEQGERQVNVNPGTGTPVMVTPRVRRGSVPFRALSLPEEDSEDGYGQKLYYAVTENLAVQGTYRKDAGGMSIVDQTGASAISPDSSAHFIVFSVGEDGRGAYTRHGQLKRTCLAPTQALDAVNCHTGNTGSDNLAIYRVSSRATTDTSTHYDDHVKYYSSNETPLWRMANDTDITDLLDVPAGGRVGIGSSVPVVPLQVQGEIHVATDYTAEEICNNTNFNVNADDCFNPNLIAGDEDAMKCGPGEYVVRIIDGRVECRLATDPVITACPPNTVAIGLQLNANGDAVPECAGVSGCPAITVNMCQVDGVQETAYIPPGVNGDLWDTPVSGTSFRRHYRCNGENWVPRSPATSGICSCTPASGSDVVQCSATNVMPGTGTAGNAGATRCNYSQCWTGTASRAWSRTCPDNVVTYENVNNDNCACREPYTLSRTRTCAQLGHPSGWSWVGTQPRQTSTWTCTGDQSGVWSGWTLVEGTDTCTCEETVETRHRTCYQYYNDQGLNGSGFTGTGVDQQRIVSCPGPTYGPWTNTSAVNCSCDETQYIVETSDVCPNAGEVGTITYFRFMDCSTGNWGPREEVNNGCAVPYNRWQQAGQQIPGDGPLPDKLGNNCPSFGATSTCSVPSGGGYAHYPCRCQ